MTPLESRPRIMLVDDNRQLCETLEELLRLKLPARVDPFYDGNSAIKRLLNPDPDGDVYQLVVLDMDIPRVQGNVHKEDHQTLGLKILQSYQLLAPGTPIIIYTNYPSFENCVACVKAGAYYYLPKSDPETGDSNHDKLVDVCRSVLYPSSDPEADPIGTWLRLNIDELVRRYKGRFVSLVPLDRARQAGIEVNQLGDKAIIEGQSIEELRVTMLQNQVLRWTEPSIVRVPVAKSKD